MTFLKPLIAAAALAAGTTFAFAQAPATPDATTTHAAAATKKPVHHAKAHQKKTAHHAAKPATAPSTASTPAAR